VSHTVWYRYQVRVTRRLSYVQLDDILSKGGGGGGGTRPQLAVTPGKSNADTDADSGADAEDEEEEEAEEAEEGGGGHGRRAGGATGMDGVAAAELSAAIEALGASSPANTTTSRSGTNNGNGNGNGIGNSNGNGNGNARRGGVGMGTGRSPSDSLGSLGSLGSVGAGGGMSTTDAAMWQDLTRLNHWAVIRHAYRRRHAALDEYLRHRTELSLSVKKDPKTMKYVVSGYTRYTPTRMNTRPPRHALPLVLLPPPTPHHPLLPVSRVPPVSRIISRSWSNATSMSLVSEYMILMCQTIGVFCQNIGAPVWFKVQAPDPPLQVKQPI